MNFSAKSNMYGYAAEAAWSCFADYVSGSADALFAVISEAPLPDAAQAALRATADARGYGAKSCAFISLSGNAAGGETRSANAAKGATSGMEPLDSEALYILVESLDPTALVAADKAAAELLGQTFRAKLGTTDRTQLMGRSAVAFDNFAAMLADPAEKQRAWTMLKKLPRFS